jgi:D-glycero-D-manno-heptose 1,7-bisphosphate phosphatase
VKPAVFLDRDGVINRGVVRDGRPFPPDRPEDLEILPGVPEALERLRSAGYLNVVVTNQPDVATGKQRREVVEAMHARLASELAIDAIKACFHVDADDCGCRKPRPGMLLEAAQELGIDLSASYMVGDRWRDVAAGQAAGCKALFINYGYAEKRPNEPFVAVKSLPAAADLILRAAIPVDRDDEGKNR